MLLSDHITSETRLVVLPTTVQADGILIYDHKSQHQYVVITPRQYNVIIHVICETYLWTQYQLQLMSPHANAEIFMP